MRGPKPQAFTHFLTRMNSSGPRELGRRGCTGFLLPDLPWAGLEALGRPCGWGQGVGRLQTGLGR